MIPIPNPNNVQLMSEKKYLLIARVSQIVERKIFLMGCVISGRKKNENFKIISLGKLLDRFIWNENETRHMFAVVKKTWEKVNGNLYVY